MKSAKLSAMVFMMHIFMIYVKRVTAMALYFIIGLAVVLGSMFSAAMLFETAWGLLWWLGISVGYGLVIAPRFAQFIEDNTAYYNTILRYYW